MKIPATRMGENYVHGAESVVNKNIQVEDVLASTALQEKLNKYLEHHFLNENTVYR